MGRRRITPHMMREIQSAFEAGHTWPEIATEFGFPSGDAVRKAMRRHEQELRSTPAPDGLAPYVSDCPVPEKVDWRVWLQNFTDQQSLYKRIDPRVSRIKLDFSSATGPLLMASVSDMHLGGGFTDHKEIRTTVEFILATEGMYLGIAGDSIEGFLPGVKPAETVEQQPSSVMAQLAAYESLTDELTAHAKLWYCTWGDHDGKWFEQTIGANIVKQFLHHKVPYFNHRGLIELVVGTQTYYLLVNHGERFNSQYSHTHPQRRAYDSYFPADVIIAGHKHHPEYRVFYHYQALREAGLNIGGKCVLVANGTFKTGPDAYSCRYWEHGIMGVPTLAFSPTEHDVNVFGSPLIAAQYRDGWRQAQEAAKPKLRKAA